MPTEKSQPRVAKGESPVEKGTEPQEEQAAPSVGEPRFLTLDDVSVYLNVSVPQVYALVRNGELPAIKIGGRGVWRVDRNQLEAYIERLHQETEEWTRGHPLNPREKG